MSSRLPDAAVAAPALTLTAEDSARGDVARLQAAASEEHGSPVLRGNVPAGPDAGPCLFLVGPEIAREAMTSKVSAFNSEQGWAWILGRRQGYATLNTDDPLHAEHRRRWAPALTSAMVLSHWPVVERCIRDWIAALRGRTEFDAYPSMRELTFRASGLTLAGLPEASIEPAFRAICTVLDGLSPSGAPRSDIPREAYAGIADAAREELATILHDTIVQRRKHRPAAAESLLDTLLEYDSFPENPDPDDAIRAHLLILLLAGHDTGATMFSRAAFLLAQQPQLAELLARELEAAGWSADRALAPAVLDKLPHLHRFQLEVGRLYPSVVNMPRVAVEEISVGGYRIEPGTRVALAAGATHLLSRLFRDPLRFDPERYADPEAERAARPFQMLTFAGGSRICMGMRYAQLEFKAICAHLVTETELAAADETPVAHAGFWNARPAGPLRIRVRPRVSAPERHRARSEPRAARHRSHGG